MSSTTPRRLSLRRKRMADKSEDNRPSKKLSPSPPVKKEPVGIVNPPIGRCDTTPIRNRKLSLSKTPKESRSKQSSFSTPNSKSPDLNLSDRMSPEVPFLCSQLTKQPECEVIWDCNSPGYSKEELKKMYSKNDSLNQTPSPAVKTTHRLHFPKPRTLLTSTSSCSNSSKLAVELDALLDKIQANEKEKINSTSSLNEECTSTDLHSLPVLLSSSQPFKTKSRHPSRNSTVYTRDTNDINTMDLIDTEDINAMDSLNTDDLADMDDIFLDDSDDEKYSAKKKTESDSAMNESLPSESNNVCNKKSLELPLKDGSKSNSVGVDKQTDSADKFSDIDDDLFDDDLFNESVIQSTQALEEQLFNKEKGRYDTPDRAVPTVSKITSSNKENESDIISAKPTRATFQLFGNNKMQTNNDNNLSSNKLKVSKINSSTLSSSSSVSSSSHNTNSKISYSCSSNNRPNSNNQINNGTKKDLSSTETKSSNAQSLLINKNTTTTQQTNSNNFLQSNNLRNKSHGLPRSKSINFTSNKIEDKSTLKRHSSSDSSFNKNNRPLYSFDESDDDYLFSMIEESEITQSYINSQESKPQITKTNPSIEYPTTKSYSATTNIKSSSVIKSNSSSNPALKSNSSSNPAIKSNSSSNPAIKSNSSSNPAIKSNSSSNSTIKSNSSNPSMNLLIKKNPTSSNYPTKHTSTSSIQSNRTSRSTFQLNLDNNTNAVKNTLNPIIPEIPIPQESFALSPKLQSTVDSLRTSLPPSQPSKRTTFSLNQPQITTNPVQPSQKPSIVTNSFQSSGVSTKSSLSTPNRSNSLSSSSMSQDSVDMIPQSKPFSFKDLGKQVKTNDNKLVNNNNQLQNKNISLSRNNNQGTSNQLVSKSTSSTLSTQKSSSAPIRCSQAEIAKKKEEAMRRRAELKKKNKFTYNPVC